MSFGSISSMNLVLKNNRNMLSKRDKFKRTFDGLYGHGKTEYDLPESTPKLLWQIRTQMKEENKIRQQKIVITFSIVMVTLITCLLYLNSNYHQILAMF